MADPQQHMDTAIAHGQLEDHAVGKRDLGAGFQLIDWQAGSEATWENVPTADGLNNDSYSAAANMTDRSSHLGNDGFMTASYGIQGPHAALPSHTFVATSLH